MKVETIFFASEHELILTKNNLNLHRCPNKTGCCSLRYWVCDLDGFELEDFKTKKEALTFIDSLFGQFD